MPNFIYVFLISIASGAAIYLLTRVAIGDRADHLPGGAVAMALVLSPWWAALSGAVLGHIFAVMAMRAWKKSEQPKYLVAIALFTFAGYLCGSIYTFTSAINESSKIALTAETQAWESFGEGGITKEFVVQHYRPCVEARLYTLRSVTSKNSPSVCLSLVVTLAAATKGRAFANEVQVAIVEWDKRDFDPVAAAKIDKIVASL